MLLPARTLALISLLIPGTVRSQCYTNCAPCPPKPHCVPKFNPAAIVHTTLKAMPHTFLPATPVETLNLVFFEQDEGLPVLESQPSKLEPGERPVTIVVPIASKELVARSVVVWGVRNSSGDFVEGGRKVFTYEGGVADGRIPVGTSPDEIEIQVKIDYVQNEYRDLEYTFRPTVSDAGINTLVQTTSNVVRQQLILRTLGSVRPNDYLIAEFRSIPLNADSEFAQSASKLYRSEQLTHAINSIIVTSVEIPVHPDDKNRIAWTIYGRLAGKKVSKSFEVENRAAFEVFANQQGQLDVWLGPEGE